MVGESETLQPHQQELDLDPGLDSPQLVYRPHHGNNKCLHDSKPHRDRDLALQVAQESTPFHYRVPLRKVLVEEVQAWDISLTLQAALQNHWTLNSRDGIQQQTKSRHQAVWGFQLNQIKLTGWMLMKW